MNDPDPDGLFAVFVEARRDGKRTQWMLFPPRGGADRAQRFIKRRLDQHGQRARWATTHVTGSSAAGAKMALELAQYGSTGWEVLTPVVVRLEPDDYEKAWAEDKVRTPYKALRAVNRVAVKRGYEV